MAPFRIKKAPDAPGLERTFVGTRQTDALISEGVRRATFFITGRPKNNGVLEGSPVTAVTATEAGA